MLRFLNKYSLYTVLFAGVITLSAACKSTEKGQESARTPQTVSNMKGIDLSSPFLTPQGDEPLHTLARNGQSNYVILLPANPRPAALEAANRLQQHLLSLSGAKLAIVREPVLKGTPFISIGDTRASEGLGKTSNLGEEGYQIASQPNRLFIWAPEPRGLVNGVSALLEEDLGVRWMGSIPAYTHFPTSATLQCKIVSRSSRPAFAVREVYYSEPSSNYWFDYNRIRPARFSGSFAKNEWEAMSLYPGGWKQHTFFRLVPAQTYAETHPEYFAERNGKRWPTPSGQGTQLCMSNAAIVDIAVAEARKALKNTPQAKLIHISQNDGGGLFCDCKYCHEINEREGSVAGSLLYFVNQVAEKLEKSHPQVKVVTFAYKETAIAPKHIHPRKNVIVELCTDKHWMRPYQPIGDDPNFIKIIDGWKAIGTELFIWDYSILLGHYLMPCPNIEVMARNLRFYRDKGVQGVMFQGAYQNENEGAERAFLRCWVWAKLMWNPDLDAALLVQDFTRHFYKEAAAPVQAYNELLHGFWESYQQGKLSADPFGPLPKDFYQQARPLIAEAKRLARDPEVKKQVAYLEAAILYHRLVLGPLSPQDHPQYDQDLDLFKAVCQANNIQRLREEVMKTGSIDAFVTASRIRSRSVLTQIPKDNIRVEDLDFRIPHLWPDEIKPRIIEDPQAQNLHAIQHRTEVKGWRVNYHVPPDQFEPGTTYEVWISVKVDWKKKPVGPAAEKSVVFFAFAYDHENAKALWQYKVMPGQLSDKQYMQFKVAEWEPKENQRFVIETQKADWAENIYIDYLEFKPLRR